MGLPIVFVHGIRVSGSMWAPVISRLTGRHTVEAPDLPGHGTRRGEAFTMDGAVSAVSDAIDRLGGRAVVVGLSLGGYVAIATAGRHPERVAGLVAVGCTALPVGIKAHAYRLAGGLAAADPELANRLSARAFLHALPRPIGEAVIAGGLSCEVIPQVAEAVTGTDPLAALARYPGRVWLVNGSRDPFRADEDRFLRACRDGRLVLIPRRGHIGMMAEPTRLAGVVEDCARLAVPDQVVPRAEPETAVAAPSAR